MTRPTTTSKDAAVLAALRVAERAVALVNRRVGSVLVHAQFRLRTCALARDPETKAWAEEMKAKVASGEIWRLLEAQPADLQVFIDRHRSSVRP